MGVGANAAARLRSLLRALGYTRVQVVDGGFAALRATGLSLGLPGAKLYVGSWSEWCRPDRPRDPAR